MLTVLLLLFPLFFSSCTSSIRYSTTENTTQIATEERDTTEQNNSINIEEYQVHSTGKASFYSNKFNGRKTASGEKFHNSEYTVAHRTFPFGTELLIENVANKKRVTVRVNDRGPFTKNRILDVTLQVAKELDFVRQGTATIRIYTKKIK
jgi:rare lipoprotein A